VSAASAEYSVVLGAIVICAALVAAEGIAGATARGTRQGSRRIDALGARTSLME
jgi:hypothetical protein